MEEDYGEKAIPVSSLLIIEEERGEDKNRTVLGSNAMNLIFLLMAWLPILIGALGIALIFLLFLSMDERLSVN
uniref:hypothetical protein n=1 Tax=Clostridium sp. NkU-1 TaxID=1095009 RepID=UPI0006D17CEF